MSVEAFFEPFGKCDCLLGPVDLVVGIVSEKFLGYSCRADVWETFLQRVFRRVFPEFFVKL